VVDEGGQVLAGMLGGALTVLSLYVIGWTMGGGSKLSKISPYYLLGFDPQTVIGIRRADAKFKRLTRGPRRRGAA